MISFSFCFGLICIQKNEAIWLVFPWQNDSEFNRQLTFASSQTSVCVCSYLLYIHLCVCAYCFYFHMMLMNRTVNSTKIQIMTRGFVFVLNIVYQKNTFPLKFDTIFFCMCSGLLFILYKFDLTRFNWKVYAKIPWTKQMQWRGKTLICCCQRVMSCHVQCKHSVAMEKFCFCRDALIQQNSDIKLLYSAV